MKIHYLYRITCLINNKNYIGQTVNPISRWRAHKRDSINPKFPIHFAIKKYGLNNMNFEIIAACKGQDNANELETCLVNQYNSFVCNEGYNATYGGFNAPKSENWHNSIREWRNSLSIEERAEINKKLSEATYRQINTQGHPSQGKLRTDEQKARMSAAKLLLDNEAIYTEEVRQRMSEAHLGHKQSLESIINRCKSLRISVEKRSKERLLSGEYKCNASNCEVKGNAKYRFYKNVRYCVKHGTRLLRNDSLEKLPPFKFTKDHPMYEEGRRKQRESCLGRIAHNRIHFTEEQVNSILSDTRSIKKISKDFNVTEKVIARVKSGKH